MKKIYFLIMLAALIAIPVGITHAQNLVLNGDLELWDDPANPTDWDKAENISQETTVHSGTYSAGHTSSSDGTQDLQQNVSGIAGGANYTISYYFLDNVTDAKTRIWSYWLQGTSTLDPNGAELRPSTYSFNNPDWQHFSVSLTAPANADGFRFEVRVYHENNVTGGMVYYDDFSVTLAGISPEPTNYPTDFTALASGIAINLDWTDATGDQLPNGYLVLASTEDNITAPTDGAPVEDDIDLSDGSGALNIAYDIEMCSFGNLSGNTPYYFKIYPYTNGGADIDYKNDGTAPAATATTADLDIIEAENFDQGWGNWQRVNVIGAEEWEIDDIHGVGGTPCAKISGYVSQTYENEDWLISPPMDFDGYTSETLSFQTAMNYTGPDLEVKISNDYDGSDPTTATWNDLEYIQSPGSWDWTPSGEINVSNLDGENVYIGFKFTSTNDESATWEVDEIMITGAEILGIGEKNTIEANVNIYPNPASDKVFISSDKNYPLSVNIYSLLGTKVLEEISFTGEGSIDIGNIKGGIYLLHFTDENGNTAIRKLVVEK